MATARLRIEEGESSREFPVGEEPVTIGRHSTNKVVLTEPAASRHHCVIEQGEGGLRVRDLRSHNGTMLNGAAVRRSPLAAGDVVTIGKARITVVAAPGGSEGRGRPKAASARGKGAKSGAAPDGRAARTGRAPSGRKAESWIDAAAHHPVTEPVCDLGAVPRGFAHREVPEEGIVLFSSRGQVVHGRDAGRGEGETTEAITVLRRLIRDAYRARATDIHVEPKSDHHLVRMRLDGIMAETARLTPAVGARVERAIKVLAELDIAQAAIVQEGHFAAQFAESKVDYRVSFTPALRGQKLVVRVIDPTIAPARLEDLQMPPWMLEHIRKLVHQDQGMLLVCGPTGAGKTSTLYAVLRTIDASRRNVVTIEDPVEYELEKITQFLVDPRKGNTIPALLRSVLRQDPDVILVGEMRDEETARTAMAAATTGHLVLSTVHARDTLGTLARLRDLGVEAPAVAASVNVILAQRLVRLVCPGCSRRASRAKDGKAERHVQSAECATCFGTGYSGRRAIFEMLTVNEELRRAISASAAPADLKQALQGTAFVSLKEAGEALAAAGITSAEEVERVIGSE